ncbi:MAG: zinc ribbon domain-containing protein, partial [Prosthecobacter sp.]|nr:zinc ribbon domain-containing protein [Prosthecobacter sp.]
DPGEPSLEETRQGLHELVQLGWVTRAGDDEWSFAETMQPHAIEWSAAVVSGLFSLLLDDPGDLNRLHVGLIRTLSGIWTFECPTQGDIVKVGRTGGQALMLTMMKAVEKLLASWLTAQAADHTGQQPQTKAVFCASCGAAIPAGAHFCAGCGKPVSMPEKKPICPGCGKPVHAGEKFCASCGHRLS